MCTACEPWPLTLAWPGQALRLCWTCAKEKVIGPLIESIHFCASNPLTLGMGRTPRETPALAGLLAALRGYFTTRGRPSIKEAQTMANDLAVNHKPAASRVSRKSNKRSICRVRSPKSSSPSAEVRWLDVDAGSGVSYRSSPLKEESYGARVRLILRLFRLIRHYAMTAFLNPFIITGGWCNNCHISSK